MNHAHAVVTGLKLDLGAFYRLPVNRDAQSSLLRDIPTKHGVHFQVSGLHGTEAGESRRIALNTLEEIRSLLPDEREEFLHIGSLPVEARDKLVARRLVEFRREGQIPAEVSDSRLAHVVRGDVLASFHEAAALAILDGLARREHLLDVLARHDGVVLRSRELLHRLLAKDVRQELTVRDRHHFLGGRVCRGFKDSDMHRKGRRREAKAQECCKGYYFFHTEKKYSFLGRLRPNERKSEPFCAHILNKFKKTAI